MKKLPWIPALSILLVLFGLFVFGLDWLYMRPDELLSYDHTARSLPYTVWYVAEYNVHAPFWHTFFYLWRSVVGDAELAGRYQGVLWSMLTLALVYRVGRGWFGAARFGWFAMAAVGTNAYFFTYAFEIRPYPVVLLSAVLSMWLFWRLLQKPGGRRAIAYGLSLTWMAYVHYFLAFLVMVQAIYALWKGRHAWRYLAGAAGLALLLWLPWAPILVNQLQLLQSVNGTMSMSHSALSTSWGEIVRLIRRATNGLPYLWGAVLLVGVWSVRRREYGLLLLWCLGVPVLMLTMNRFVAVYDPRYIVYTAVGLSLAAGIAIAALPSARERWAMIGIFIALNVWLLPENLPDRTPHRRIFNTMNALREPGDVVLFADDEHHEGMVAWNINQYLDEALQDNIVCTLDEAQAARRVWFVSGDLHAEHAQQAFDTLERTHPLERVTGKCWGQWCFVAQLLEGAPSREPVAVFEAPEYDDRLPFYGVYVDEVSRAAVGLRLWWMVDAPLVLDYSISVRLTDAAGNVIVQADSPPLTSDGELMRTSTMTPGQMVVDYRWLRLPPDLPAGEYTLEVIVYQPVEGYNLRTNAGEVIQIETITVP